MVRADGVPFRFEVKRHNASIVEFMQSGWERARFRTEADALAAIANFGSAA